ncbi:MAG TPA: hypothetical protein VGX23_03005 [Actinocrinis sp.]|nr:hypothetical protein [Actinocrinis sp.]
MIREYDAYTGPDGGRLGWPLDGGELLAEAGFGGIEEIDVEQQILVPDADTFWQFALSYGSRALIDTLPERRRDEFEAKLRAELANTDPIVYEAGATLYQARA